MSDHNPYSLPHLSEVFRALQAGYHYTIDDGSPYYALRDNRSDYEQLLAALGYQLNEDPRGFFYLTADQFARQSRQIERIAVFTFILVEHVWQSLDRTRQSIETTLLESPWTIDGLPHLSSERYIGLLRQVLGIRDGEVGRGELQTLVRAMAEFGFIAFEDSKQEFRFRPAVHRVLDLAYVALETDDAGTGAAPNALGEAPGGEPFAVTTDNKVEQTDGE